MLEISSPGLWYYDERVTTLDSVPSHRLLVRQVCTSNKISVGGTEGNPRVGDVMCDTETFHRLE